MARSNDPLDTDQSSVSATRGRRAALLGGVALLGTACLPGGGDEGEATGDAAPDQLAFDGDPFANPPLDPATLEPEDLAGDTPEADAPAMEDTATPASDAEGNAGPRNEGPLGAGEPRTPGTTAPSTPAPTTTAPTTTAPPTTAPPTTATPTTASPTSTAPPSTLASAPPSTAVATTAVATTAVSTTAAPTTAAPTTAAPTTAAPTTAAPTTTAPPPPPPLAASARLVTGRLTFAPTPATDAAVLNLGLRGWIDDQMTKTGPDPAIEAELASAFSSLGVSFQQLRSIAQGENEVRDQLRNEVVFADLYRGLKSEHQVFEVMTRVWYDHFNVSFSDSSRWMHKTSHYQESVIRPHAMGRFEDLLRATAESPAMMRYLDNYRSDARQGINENYGRELLELHTLGIDQNGNQIYTEADVVGASHVMSGWSLWTSSDDPNVDEFRYRPDYHSTEPVSILNGQWTNEGLDGKAAGDSLITFLAHHPQTARYVSYKLCRHFVSDRPSEALIESAASVFLANDTQIAPTLRHIVDSEAFARSVGAKVRRPQEVAIAAMRALDLDISPDPVQRMAEQLRRAMEDLNHHPWQWETPDGYPDIAEEWVSSDGLLRRWNLTARMARDRMTDSRLDDHVEVNLDRMRGFNNTAGQLLEQLADRANLGALPDETNAELLALVGLTAETPIADVDDNDVRDLLSFLLSHPFFQLR